MDGLRLTRIAINEALMKLRRRRPTVSLDDERESQNDFVVHELEDWGPSPEQRYSQQELQHILSEAIGELRPGLRVVTQLRDVEQLSTEETAEILGLSLPAVKSRSRRARLTLREMLNRYFGRSKFIRDRIYETFSRLVNLTSLHPVLYERRVM
jgi:RNA polymerase sigma-70 factor (ECF subfamily)